MREREREKESHANDCHHKSQITWSARRNCRRKPNRTRLLSSPSAISVCSCLRRVSGRQARGSFKAPSSTAAQASPHPDPAGQQLRAASEAARNGQDERRTVDLRSYYQTSIQSQPSRGTRAMRISVACMHGDVILTAALPWTCVPCLEQNLEWDMIARPQYSVQVQVAPRDPRCCLDCDTHGHLTAEA